MYYIKIVNPFFAQKAIKCARSWTPLLLDIELVGNFWKSRTNRGIKNFIKYHKNIFKSYDEFENLKFLAQKLS